MKIGLVSLHFAEYGWRLAKALAKNGNQVLLVLRPDNAYNELGMVSLCHPDVEVVLLVHRPLKDIRILHTMFHLVRSIKNFRPDVIHVQETLQDYLVLTMPVLARIAPIVLTVHDHISHSGRDLRLGVRRASYRKRLRRQARAVIVHGQLILQEIQDGEPYLRGRVRSVPHGVLGPERLPGIDSEYGNILFFGRIEAYKGLGVLLEAVKILQAKRLGATLTIAGRGTDLVNHRATIAHISGCNVIDEFITVEDIPRLFQRSMIVALPYLDGTQSGVAAMAVNYGRPIVATRVGSIPELVKDGVNGVLVDSGSVQQFADAIESLLNDEALTSALKENASYLAATELSWKEIAAKTTAVYLDSMACPEHTLKAPR